MGLPELVIAIFLLSIAVIFVVAVFKFLAAAVRSGTKQALRDKDRNP